MLPTDPPTRRPTPKCLPKDPDPFCTTVCDQDNDQETEWNVQFDLYSYNPLTDVTTFNYRASTLQSPPDQWCTGNNKQPQIMTIIFLYISSCCQPPNNSYLRNITHSKLKLSANNPTNDISLWGINGNNWIYHPFQLEVINLIHLHLN